MYYFPYFELLLIVTAYPLKYTVPITIVIHFMLQRFQLGIQNSFLQSFSWRLNITRFNAVSQFQNIPFIRKKSFRAFFCRR